MLELTTKEDLANLCLVPLMSDKERFALAQRLEKQSRKPISPYIPPPATRVPRRFGLRVIPSSDAEILARFGYTLEYEAPNQRWLKLYE